MLLLLASLLEVILTCSRMISPYRSIKTAADYAHLQEDVDTTSACIQEKKKLKVNATKCKTMLISRKRSNMSTPPQLITVAQKGHPSLQIFKVAFCKLVFFQFCTFVNMQFVNQALWQTCCLSICIRISTPTVRDVQ